jgi:hypothetical protein
MTERRTPMQANEPKYYWRGPLPPYPAKVDLVAWLLMSSQERRQHLHCEADVPIMGHTEADVARMTDGAAAYWDHWAGLLDMDAKQRAGEVGSDIERACADMRTLSVEERAEEVEHQTQRWVPFWEKVAEEAARRRQAPSEKDAP